MERGVDKREEEEQKFVYGVLEKLSRVSDLGCTIHTLMAWKRTPTMYVLYPVRSSPVQSEASGGAAMHLGWFAHG
jgi:hypothetical protein